VHFSDASFLNKYVVSKLLEHLILCSIFPLLGTIDNQYAFKAEHGTDNCKFLLKQIFLNCA